MCGKAYARAAPYVYQYQSPPKIETCRGTKLRGSSSSTAAYNDKDETTIKETYGKSYGARRPAGRRGGRGGGRVLARAAQLASLGEGGREAGECG